MDIIAREMENMEVDADEHIKERNPNFGYRSLTCLNMTR